MIMAEPITAVDSGNAAKAKAAKPRQLTFRFERHGEQFSKKYFEKKVLTDQLSAKEQAVRETVGAEWIEKARERNPELAERVDRLIDAVARGLRNRERGSALFACLIELEDAAIALKNAESPQEEKQLRRKRQHQQ